MKTNLIPLLQVCSTRVIENTNFSKKSVEFVARNYFCQIRHIPHSTEGERLNRIKIVQAKIVIIAQAYGAREALHSIVLNPCTVLVFEKFGHLSLEDIEEAYRMKSSGQLKIVGAEMYGGIFNCDNFGKVLTAYNDWRKMILAKFIEEKVRFETEEKRFGMEFIRKLLYEVCFPFHLEQAKETIEDWREVPLYWYSAAIKRDFIVFEHGEAQAIFEDAEGLVNGEIELRTSEDLAHKLNKKLVFTAASFDKENIQKSIARRLTVFRKIILNPDWEAKSFFPK